MKTTVLFMRRPKLIARELKNYASISKNVRKALIIFKPISFLADVLL